MPGADFFERDDHRSFGGRSGNRMTLSEEAIISAMSRFWARLA